MKGHSPRLAKREKVFFGSRQGESIRYEYKMAIYREILHDVRICKKDKVCVSWAISRSFESASCMPEISSKRGCCELRNNGLFHARGKP